MPESALENSSQQNLAHLRNKYLTFILGEEVFAMEVHRMQEIVSISDIQERQAGREYIRGTIKLRGEGVPIVDLGERFGIEASQDTSKSCFIVVEVEGTAGPLSVGMLVDQVAEVVGIAEGQVQSSHDFDKYLFSELLDGMVILEEKIILVMNLEKVISPEDVKFLEEMLAEDTPPETPQESSTPPVEDASAPAGEKEASASGVMEEGPHLSEMSGMNADLGAEISQEPAAMPDLEPMTEEAAPEPAPELSTESESESALDSGEELSADTPPDNEEKEQPPKDSPIDSEVPAGYFSGAWESASVGGEDLGDANPELETEEPSPAPSSTEQEHLESVTPPAMEPMEEEAGQESPPEPSPAPASQSAFDSSEDMHADTPPDPAVEAEPEEVSKVSPGYFAGAWESASIGGETPGDFDPMDEDPVDSSTVPAGMEGPGAESVTPPALDPAPESVEDSMDGEGEIMELKEPIALEDPLPGSVEDAVELEGTELEEVHPSETDDKEDSESTLAQLRRTLEEVQAKLAKTEAAQVETQHALTEAWAKVSQLESERK